MFRQHILPTLIWSLYRVLIWTWKVRLHLPDSLQKTLADHQPVIFAHWHGHELAIIPMVKPFRLATMTSTSKDGQLVDFVIRKLGGATSKGSSTRGGTRALRGLVRLVKSGRSASMAVDGPKGPLHEVKPGVFELSVLTKAPIFPVGVAAHRVRRFEKSWNKTFLPLPFATVSIHVSEGWPAVEKSADRRDPELSRRLAAELHSATKLAAQGLESDAA